MIYEIRTYTFKPLRGAEWLALYKSDGLPLQQEFLGQLIGFFTTEIGDISQVVHIWAYESMGDREARRAAMGKDPGWHNYLKNQPPGSIITQETKLCSPASFSPLK